MADPAKQLDSPQIVTAMFHDFRQAEQAYRAAVELGYEASDINVLMSEETRQSYLAGAHGNTSLAEKAEERAPESSKSADKLGGPAGGTAGTLAPAIAAVGAALLIPGLGLAVAGPIAIALTAAGAVGVTTGLIGALTNWGIPKERAKDYESAVRKGGIVIGVKPHSTEDAEALSSRWRASGGEWVAI
jgi:hypothetical protein